MTNIKTVFWCLLKPSYETQPWALTMEINKLLVEGNWSSIMGSRLGLKWQVKHQSHCSSSQERHSIRLSVSPPPSGCYNSIVIDFQRKLMERWPIRTGFSSWWPRRFPVNRAMKHIKRPINAVVLSLQTARLTNDICQLFITCSLCYKWAAYVGSQKMPAFNFQCSVTYILCLECMKNVFIQYLCMLYFFVIYRVQQSASGSKNPIHFLHRRIDFEQ